MAKLRLVSSQVFYSVVFFCLLPITSVNAELVAVQIEDMYHFGTDPREPVKGVATLTRKNDSVDILISTSELEPMNAYTLWWVIFNNPAACEDGCNGPDLSNPAVDGSLLWGAGFLADMDGFLTVWAELLVDEPPGEIVSGNPNGLLSTTAAEIHAVLRLKTNAGTPVEAGQVAEWVSSFGSACPGGDGCVNKQFAVFAAIPVPAAIWLFGSALGLLGWLKCRAA